MAQGLAAIFLLVLIIAGMLYTLFSIYCVIGFFNAGARKQKENSFPPVSIIKPLKGMDAGLYENLASFCIQNYPDYEVILSCAKKEDIPQIPVCDQKKISMYTVTAQERGWGNPKLETLQSAIERSHHPLIAISDSDMRVDGAYLRTVVSEYLSGHRIGVVTNLYKISKPATMGSAFESLTLALDVMPSVLVARKLEGMTFGLGASMLFSKESLDAIGGFRTLADYLADDYQLGNQLWKKGYTNLLSRYVMETVPGPMSVHDYFTHQLRWARTYRACRPKGYAGYGITHMLFFTTLLFAVYPAPLILLVLTAVLSLRMSLGLVVYRKCIRTTGWLRWLPLVPLKDLASFGIWLWSFFGKTVEWRGKRYKIVQDGKVVPLPQ